jgi:hypothetical protein
VSEHLSHQAAAEVARSRGEAGFQLSIEVPAQKRARVASMTIVATRH